MKTTGKLPLFIVSGASGVGKSTASELLFQTEKDYIVLESDLIWNPVYDTPDDNYYEYRRVWTRLAANVAQNRTLDSGKTLSPKNRRGANDSPRAFSCKFSKLMLQ